MSLYDRVNEQALNEQALTEDKDVARAQREIGQLHARLKAAVKKAHNNVAWGEDDATDFRDQWKNADLAIKKMVMVLANQH